MRMRFLRTGLTTMKIIMINREIYSDKSINRAVADYIDLATIKVDL